MPILVLLVVSGGLVWAANLFEVTVPSSVTITTTGDLLVLDLDGAVLSSLNFGSVAPGGTVSKTLQIKNLSNTELGIAVQCDLVGMNWGVTNGDGSEWVHRTRLPAGNAIQITVSITPPAEANAGTHSFNLKISGE